MQIANLNINLPQKKEEEFLKIDFTSLFDFDFKEHKTLDFALDLESIKDDEVYDSKLFSIANSFDNSKRCRQARSCSSCTEIYRFGIQHRCNRKHCPLLQ